MKTFFISTSATHQATRYQVARMQADLVKAQTEMVSGKVADAGLALGAKAGNALSLTRDIDRLENIKISNGAVALRLGATQTALSGLGKLADDLTSTLVIASPDPVKRAALIEDARTALSTMTGLVNTRVADQYIFAGTDTDVRPLGDLLAPDSPARQQFDETVDTYLADAGLTDISQMTGTQMEELLDRAEDLFLGAGWKEHVSGASDDAIQSRISLNETVRTSVSANNDGVRQLAFAASAVVWLMDRGIGEDATNALIARTVEAAGTATGALTQTRTDLGRVEARVTAANERLSMQVDLFRRSHVDLVGVDPYEALTRIEGLRAQIETSYNLTARMQQLSLLRFL